jgi:hypothetical protein
LNLLMIAGVLALGLKSPGRRRRAAGCGRHPWLQRLEAYGHESPGVDAPDVERGRAMGERTPGLETNSDASPRAVVEELGSEVAGVREELDTLLAELDRRRHEVFDVRLQLRRTRSRGRTHGVRTRSDRRLFRDRVGEIPQLHRALSTMATLGGGLCVVRGETRVDRSARATARSHPRPRSGARRTSERDRLYGPEARELIEALRGD